MNDKLEDTKPRPALNLALDAPESETPALPETPADLPPAEQTPLQGMRPVPPQITQQPQAPMPPQSQQMPPRPPATPRSPIEPSGPPRWLFWGILGVFILGMVGIVGAFVGFRYVLEPAQQERVMQALPFMEAFLGPRPQPGDTLPTPESSSAEALSPDDLLSGLNLSADATATPEESTPEPTIEPTLAPTEEAALPTATLEPTVAPTLEPTVQATLEPTQSSAAEPTASSETAQTVTDNSVVIPRSIRLTGFNYQAQTWNNCGPANITMALSYYGWQEDQAYAATFLKPGGREDKNVSPEEMVSFVNEQSSVTALVRVGGTVELMKQLLANNIPVIIESGSTPEGYEWLGHYRLLVGYDDNQGIFYILDSFVGSENPGAGITESYPDFDDEWHQFNRTFIVVYEPQRQALVERIMGSYMDETAAHEIALETATTEATANTTDGHAWFNMGSSLAALGNYERAALAFDRARVEGVPWRMMWYQFGAYEAYLGSGRLPEVLSLTEANLGNGGEYVEETYFWRARALEAQGRTNEAAASYRSALNRNPRFQAATDALNALGF